MLYYIDMTMGYRIKVARDRLGLNQEEVGNAIGVSKQSVNQYETKGTSPEPHRIPALRQILRVTFAWLHAGEGPPPDKDSIEVRMDDLMVENYRNKKPARPGKPSKSA